MPKSAAAKRTNWDGDGDGSCAVCLAEFRDGETLRLLPRTAIASIPGSVPKETARSAVRPYRSPSVGVQTEETVPRHQASRVHGGTATASVAGRLPTCAEAAGHAPRLPCTEAVCPSRRVPRTRAALPSLRATVAPHKHAQQQQHQATTAHKLAAFHDWSSSLKEGRK